METLLHYITRKRPLLIQNIVEVVKMAVSIKRIKNKREPWLA